MLRERGASSTLQLPYGKLEDRVYWIVRIRGQ